MQPARAPGSGNQTHFSGVRLWMLFCMRLARPRCSSWQPISRSLHPASLATPDTRNQTPPRFLPSSSSIWCHHRIEPMLLSLPTWSIFNKTLSSMSTMHKRLRKQPLIWHLELYPTLGRWHLQHPFKICLRHSSSCGTVSTQYAYYLCLHVLPCFVYNNNPKVKLFLQWQGLQVGTQHLNFHY